MRWSILLLLAGCHPGDSEPDSPFEVCPVAAPDYGGAADLMLPGTDCLSCHVEGGHARSVFVAAGTVFTGATCPEPVVGATVHLVDSDGTALDVVTNEVGNFVVIDGLMPPLEVTITGDAGTATMSAAGGGCGGCHAAEGLGYVHLP